ncbi:MAG: glycosyltransferase [Planctomycetota bacterium]|nr:MAG: glycosyltransferase [Planctomycetota bacterium]
MSRHAILVLGMHRSGTSALTGMLGAMGAALPGDPMPATADNPTGYWESRGIARLNNRLLESAGTRWNDDAAIPAKWFADPARERDRDEARRLLDDAFAAETLFALKDPRLCRLLPFWRQVLSAAGIDHSAVLVLRDPLEVARSLAARKDVPEFRPAAVAAPSRALLLWLRYVLDAERHSRDLPRVAVDYARLVSDWRAAVEPLLDALPIALPTPGSAAAAALATLSDARLHRNRAEKEQGEGGVARGLGRLRTLHASLVAVGGLARPSTAAEADALASTFDRLVALYAPLRRNADPLAERDDWSQAILAHVAEGEAQPPATRSRRILFLSAAPASIGHVYRVGHPVAALTARGWQASWLPLDDGGVSARLDDADIVVVFRARRTEAFDSVRDRCRARGVPLVYDVDDLVFDPELMAAGFFAYLDDLPEADRLRWLADAASYRDALAACDAAVLTTAPLAAAAGRHCTRLAVLPNCLDATLTGLADAACAAVKPSAADGRPRLGFASGTPTHRRDFAVAATALARLFDRRSEPLLVVVGALDLAAYPELARHAPRIEARPGVPLHDLFGEVARFDVNLAPLELGNPFCEAKSAVRCLAAAAVGVPSVASPTVPLCDAILPGSTGLLAADAGAWEQALERLVDDDAGRLSMAAAARIHARARFGPETYADLAERTFATLADAPLPAEGRA